MTSSMTSSEAAQAKKRVEPMNSATNVVATNIMGCTVVNLDIDAESCDIMVVNFVVSAR